jgi:poly(hydroxyalkanoate) depolymerase family esterase
MNISTEDLARVTALTRAGQLMEATKLIQQALGSHSPNPKTATAQPDLTEGSPATDEKLVSFLSKVSDSQDVVDVEFREVASQTSSFAHAHFTWGAEEYLYRLFVPSERTEVATPRPLVVMLHGCKQDSADFARGTDMNAIAEIHNCLVLYPEQLSKRNGMRCWNWFEPQHQRRDVGEPGMIAALALDVAARHGGDLQRIYIAGLSAGGAMAAVTAGLYPNAFAALGVHSGLAAGSASDASTAFAAMRSGKRKSKVTSEGVNPSPLPTIVFQGTADKTVAPGNADRIMEEGVAAWTRAGVPLERRTEVVQSQAGGERHSTRIQFRANNRTLMEQWSITAGPHAWSGGDRTGSFTDPAGPSASKFMLEFFLQHTLGKPHDPN